MKGLWWIGDDQNLCFKDLPEPIIEDPHDVKIQVAFSGDYLQTIELTVVIQP